MSITYILTPYKPKEAASGVGEHFKIDAQEYKRKLVEEWSNIEFYPPDSGYGLLLLWHVSYPDIGEIGPLHRLYKNHQTVAFGYSDKAGAFIHWHRALIDSKHVLYLYNDVTFETVEITQDLTPHEIQDIVDNV